MQIPFNKYHGTGNDFIIIDNRKNLFNPSDTVLISKLCSRRSGIGADGLILISLHEIYDFEMKYFNSDGNESSMCGNGGRCAAAYALRASIAGNKQTFLAFDGPHKSEIADGIVRLQMNDVTGVRKIKENYFINTGSPHYVCFVKNVKESDVKTEGKKIRWLEDFEPGGTNVNFAELTDNGLFVRTFERGVEDETLSCGTGVTASAIASVLSGYFDTSMVNVRTLGGELSVELKPGKEKITGIWLSGPATFVYQGVIEV
ncbi:MAG: diaminopimelate epimerase [Odoribacter sp.]|nr:diaminopimelate epimerase [Odoribacter sp.]